MNKAILIFILVIGISSVAYSQLQRPSPAQVLRLARSTFEQGRLHELPKLLENLESFNQSEKVDAYKLLTQAYIYLEEPEQADETMLKLLRADPEFQKNEAIDPAEFVALYKTFRTTPVYRYGLKAAINATQPNVKKYTGANDGKASYTYGVGFQVGLVAEFPLTKKITLSPELNFLAHSFDFSNSYFNRYSTTGKERLFWVSLPITMQYQLIEHKLNPFVGAGLSIDYLIAANNQLETRIESLSPVSESNYDDKELFNNFNLSALVSAGIKTKIKKSLLIVEVRYAYGIPRVTNEPTRYSNQSTLFDNKFVHGFFSLNTLSLATSYQFNKYNPKKNTR